MRRKLTITGTITEVQTEDAGNAMVICVENRDDSNARLFARVISNEIVSEDDDSLNHRTLRSIATRGAKAKLTLEVELP